MRSRISIEELKSWIIISKEGFRDWFFKEEDRRTVEVEWEVNLRLKQHEATMRYNSIEPFCWSHEGMIERV